MRKYIVCMLIACIPLITIAQSSKTFVVTDARTRTPLAGASIKLNSKTILTTNDKGIITVDCSTKEIEVSFIGYETRRINPKNCKIPDQISLTPSASSLEDVEISATSSNNRSSLAQPVSITRLKDRELLRGNGLFLDDAINGNVPGVTMQRRAVSSGQQFNIRGYNNGISTTTRPNSNFDGQGYKVYLNGIPVTDAEGITVMDDIDFASIGNVEVTKGPAGSLYGLAIAGAINLKTKQPIKGQTSLSHETQIGSYGLRRYTTSFQTAGKQSSLLLNYGKQYADGYMSHTASKKEFASLSWQADLNEKQSVSLYGGYSNSYDERGGELTITQYFNKDYSGNPEYIKRNAHSEVISFRAGFSHTYRFNKEISNTTILFGTGATTNASSAGGWTDKNPINYGLRSTMDMHFEYKNGVSLTGITGVEFQKQYAQIIGYNMVANPSSSTADWIIGAMRSNQSTVSATNTVFSEWTLQLPKDVSITAGVGVSNMRIELNDKFYVAGSTNPTRYENRYSGMLAPHIAINKLISKKVSVYASYSSGFKAPVSSYFFIPATGQLNTGLRAERGDQIEIGTKGSILGERLFYELALFNTVYNDKMTAIAVPLNGSTTTTAYSYIANGGKQNHSGVELLVKFTALRKETGVVKAIRPFANFTYSNFTYSGYQFIRLNTPPTSTTVQDFDGKAVVGTAPWVVNAGVDAEFGFGFYGNITYMYKDAAPFTSDGLNIAPAYNLLNGKIGWQKNIDRHWGLHIYAGAYNLTNQQYPYMIFANQLPDAYLPAPLNTNFFGGINLKYQF